MIRKKWGHWEGNGVSERGNGDTKGLMERDGKRDKEYEDYPVSSPSPFPLKPLQYTFQGHKGFMLWWGGCVEEVTKTNKKNPHSQVYFPESVIKVWVSKIWLIIHSNRSDS